MIPVAPGIQLEDSEIDLDFVRASGPGGQNVNKVSTAVKLRFDVARSPSLPPAVRERLTRLCGRRISGEGVLTIDARRHRTQEKNREDAVERLIALIRKAAEPPIPRRKTKPSLASRKRRLESKRTRGALKRTRRPDQHLDD